MTTPRLSVLMTVYNGGAFLKPAVDSVLNATMGDLEFVVVDNVSTDGSREWLRTLTDPRVRLIENEVNLGQTGALRRGLEACRAPVVARLDADDLAEPDRFARQLEFLDRHAHVVLVGGQSLSIGPDDRVLSKSRLPTKPDRIAAVMTVANPFVHSAAAFRREAALAAGGYQSEYTIAQDYALWSALLRAGGTLANLPEVVCRLRLHPGQVTASGLGQREMGEALTITTANQAWALGQDPDPALARSLQRLWLGASGAVAEAGDPSAAAAVARLLSAAKLTPMGRAQLALQLAAGRHGGLLPLKLRLVLWAVGQAPGVLVTPGPYKALIRAATGLRS